MLWHWFTFNLIDALFKTATVLLKKMDAGVELLDFFKNLFVFATEDAM